MWMCGFLFLNKSVKNLAFLCQQSTESSDLVELVLSLCWWPHAGQDRMCVPRTVERVRPQEAGTAEEEGSGRSVSDGVQLRSDAFAMCVQNHLASSRPAQWPLLYQGHLHVGWETAGPGEPWRSQTVRLGSWSRQSSKAQDSCF